MFERPEIARDSLALKREQPQPATTGATPGMPSSASSPTCSSLTSCCPGIDGYSLQLKIAQEDPDEGPPHHRHHGAGAFQRRSSRSSPRSSGFMTKPFKTDELLERSRTPRAIVARASAPWRKRRFDAIVVGAGPAGISAAIAMARAGLKGRRPRARRIPGRQERAGRGALLEDAPRDRARVLEGRRRPPSSGPIVEQKTCITTEDSFVTVGLPLHKSSSRASPTATRSSACEFDQWYAEAGRGGRRRGVLRRHGERRGQGRLRQDHRHQDFRRRRAERWRRHRLRRRQLDPGAEGGLHRRVEVLRGGARRQGSHSASLRRHRGPLSAQPGEGATMEMFGSVSLGMLGYAFLYTNKESLALGVGCKLSDYQRTGLRPSDHLEHVKRHPLVKKLISGGKTARIFRASDPRRADTSPCRRWPLTASSSRATPRR